MPDPNTRTPNSGTGLPGASYSRRNHRALTSDQPGRSRWFAIDEAGNDGDQLYGREHRYFVLGGIAIDDAEAAEILQDIRTRARVQAPEIKFQRSFSKLGDAWKRDILAELLSPSGALAGRTMLYVVDKRYMIATKLVDLLIEERYHALGIDVVSNGIVRKIAIDLATWGPKAVGADHFDVLLATTAMFFSKKNRRGDKISADELYRIYREAASYSRRKKNPAVRHLADVFEFLAKRTRVYAEEFAAERSQAAAGVPSAVAGLDDDAMDPIIPALAALVSSASARFGRLDILADEQRLLTDEKFDVLDKAIAAMITTWHQRDGHALRGELVRGQSASHPSLQLADLVSGAGLASTRHSDTDPESQEDLDLAVRQIFLPDSLLIP
ncbi:DUF3800 domain-containing protein [Streptomyces sp. NEAU-Y11]|uniref:DUF3800 domain-containing protein n=1 Tax=Streptomyces cucumeris TaxID=2962890 RepID=UPI0020C90EDC|nr:DUF3800 domain-containing protein [Streptomyces sp. NEAU-Y11]MCP9207184.1 DUF3800 domain-containing protein [Streptomyces sp. NEAU-Y11]